MNETGTSFFNGESTQHPAFSCPACHAKNVLFAMSRQARRRSRLVPVNALPQTALADYGIICPKCRVQLALVEDTPEKNNSQNRITA